MAVNSSRKRTQHQVRRGTCALLAVGSAPSFQGAG